MALETGDYINDLVITNPASSDAKSQGDDHLRLIKKTLKECLNGFSGGILLAGTDVGAADAYVITPTTALVAYSANQLVLVRPANTNTGACTINISALGATSIKTPFGDDPTAGDIVANQPVLLMYDGTNFVLIGGSTAMQKTGNQILTGDLEITGTLDVGGVLTGATANFSGAVTAATAAFGASGSQVATLDFVNAVSFGAPTLPGQTGADGKFLTTEAGSASWSAGMRANVMRFVDGTDTTKKLAFDVSTFTSGQTRTLTVRNENITLAGATATDALRIYDYTDTTKKASFQLGGLTASSNRVITVADENMTIFTPGWKMLATVTASSATAVDIETVFTSSYEHYMIVCSDVTTGVNEPIYAYLKVGGSYLGASQYNYTNVSNGVAATAAGANFIAIAGGSLTTGSTCAGNYYFFINQPLKASRRKGMHWHGIDTDGSTGARHIAGAAAAVVGQVGDLTGVRFAMQNGGAFLSGTFHVFGLRKTI